MHKEDLGNDLVRVRRMFVGRRLQEDNVTTTVTL
jgi:hypothetical protein